MKRKGFLLVAMAMLFAITTTAQRFALIDMEYILKNIPAYEMTNEQFSQLSKKWESEIETLQQEAQNMYKSYQSELVFLSTEMQSERQKAIIQKEQDAMELKRQYFGTEGELFQRRTNLMKPIQDEIYNAVKDVATDKGYQLVLDRASAMNIMFASPQIDISDEVLVKLGYSK